MASMKSGQRAVLVTLHRSALLRGDPAERDSFSRAWLQDPGHADKPPPATRSPR